tara:strand:+ start:1106 stop:1294 length:189 start_codon:yes stop_codon:yes gene_type:complete
MKNLAHMSLKGHVAESILIIRDAFGIESNGLSFGLSRKDIAAAAGTAYEAVIRMLNVLVKDG